MAQFLKKHIVLIGVTLVCALAALGAVSCTSEYDEPRNVIEISPNLLSEKRTVDEAVEIAINNLGMIDRDVPISRSAKEQLIANVTVIGDRGILSRSGQASIDTLIYAVNFQNDEGFALVPASRKADELLAICEQGNYTAGCEESNPGFAMYISMAVPKLIDIENTCSEATQGSLSGNNLSSDLTPYNPNNNSPLQTKETDDTTWYCHVMPRVKVNWSQQGIYGSYAPNGVAGCGPVAIAQTMSYFEWPKYMKFTFSGHELDKLDIDWSMLKQHIDKNFVCGCSFWTAGAIHQQIGHLLRQIGEEAHSSYGSKGTSTNKNDTRNYLISNGYNVSNISKYEKGDSKLIGNGVILIRGKNKNGIGHIWVLDGVKKYKVLHKCFTRHNNNADWEVMSISEYQYHFNHFNWGWGNWFNGWFNDMVFDAYSPIETDNKDMNTSFFGQEEGNDDSIYVSNIEYMIVTKS